MAKTPKGFKKGAIVVCPCCGNFYETDDHLPFTAEEYDLYRAAPELLKALKAIIGCLGEGGYLPSCGKTITDQAREAIARAEKGY